MHERSAIMKFGWAQYQNMQGLRQPFNRKLFADVLRFTWAGAKRRVRYQAEAEIRRIAAIQAFNAAHAATAAPMSELEQRIDRLKYLSFRYDIGRMAQEMRAGAARGTGAV